VPERNVAKHKPAIQPTTYWILEASLAVDGDFSPTSMSCNLAELHSWWALDLIQRFLVKEVIISTEISAGRGYTTFSNLYSKLDFIKGSAL